jgi:ankyrin repeat protein
MRRALAAPPARRRRGNLSEVKRMIERGADVNTKDGAEEGYGWTGVNSAAAAGHKQIVELLVRKRADLDAVNAFGHTPLHSAAARGHMHVVRFIAEMDQEYWEGTDEYKHWCRGEGLDKRFDEAPFWIATGEYLDRPSKPPADGAQQNPNALSAAELASAQDHDYVCEYLLARREELGIFEDRLKGTNRVAKGQQKPRPA